MEDKRKKALIEMMRDDEKSGLYDPDNVYDNLKLEVSRLTKKDQIVLFSMLRVFNKKIN